jgi:hypothetical protein
MSSDEEQESITLSENADALLSIMDGITNDMEIIEKKIEVICGEVYRQGVRSRSSPMNAVWDLYKFPTVIEFDFLLERLFQSAERLDVPARIVHFTDELALLFGRSSMSLFEFTNLLIDSLDFDSGIQGKSCTLENISL